MIAKDSNNHININYLISENTTIPKELLLILQSETSQLDTKNSISQIIIEQQQYNNCGPEVIENFMLFLTGSRLIQTERVPFHSQLIENTLLSNISINDCSTEVLWSDMIWQ